jgi:hypothetical protein
MLVIGRIYNARVTETLAERSPSGRFRPPTGPPQEAVAVFLGRPAPSLPANQTPDAAQCPDRIGRLPHGEARARGRTAHPRTRSSSKPSDEMAQWGSPPMLLPNKQQVTSGPRFGGVLTYPCLVHRASPRTYARRLAERSCCRLGPWSLRPSWVEQVPGAVLPRPCGFPLQISLRSLFAPIFLLRNTLVCCHLRPSGRRFLDFPHASRDRLVHTPLPLPSSPPVPKHKSAGLLCVYVYLLLRVIKSSSLPVIDSLSLSLSSRTEPKQTCRTHNISSRGLIIHTITNLFKHILSLL